VQTRRTPSRTGRRSYAFVNKQTGSDFTKLINSWLDAKSTPRPA
jgi:hypothetical protein